MLSRVLRSGDRIELQRYGYADGEMMEGIRLASNVIDVIDDHIIVISPIRDDVRTVLSENGDQFDMRFIASDGSYTCHGEVINITKEQGEYRLTVRILSDLQRDRRRKYFRIDVVRPLSYRNIGNMGDTGEAAGEFADYCGEDNEGAEELPFISGVLANISGGGMKFSSHSPLRWDDLIETVIRLSDDDDEPVTIKGHVIYTEDTANRNMRYEHRVEFIEVPTETKEKIIKFVFNEERKQRNSE